MDMDNCGDWGKGVEGGGSKREINGDGGKMKKKKNYTSKNVLITAMLLSPRAFAFLKRVQKFKTLCYKHSEEKVLC